MQFARHVGIGERALVQALLEGGDEQASIKTCEVLGDTLVKSPLLLSSRLRQTSTGELTEDSLQYGNFSFVIMWLQLYKKLPHMFRLDFCFAKRRKNVSRLCAPDARSRRLKSGARRG